MGIEIIIGYGFIFVLAVNCRRQ